MFDLYFCFFFLYFCFKIYSKVYTIKRIREYIYIDSIITVRSPNALLHADWDLL